jgi:hypothetical protein
MLNPAQDMKDGPGLRKGTKYKGTVVANNDSGEENGKYTQRIRARIDFFEGISDSDLPWAVPDMSHADGASSKSGSVDVPAIGTFVWVEFQDGSPHHPIYSGYHVDETTALEEGKTNYPNRKVTKLESGHLMVVDKTTGETFIRNMKDLILYVGGDVNLHVVGNVNEVVDGNVVRTVKGNVDETVEGNYTRKVSGDINDQAGGNWMQKATSLNTTSTTHLIQTATFGLTATSALIYATSLMIGGGGAVGKFDAGGATIASSGPVGISGSRIDLQGVSATMEVPETPTAPESPAAPEAATWTGIPGGEAG